MKRQNFNALAPQLSPMIFQPFDRNKNDGNNTKIAYKNLFSLPIGFPLADNQLGEYEQNYDDPEPSLAMSRTTRLERPTAQKPKAFTTISSFETGCHLATTTRLIGWKELGC